MGDGTWPSIPLLACLGRAGATRCILLQPWRGELLREDHTSAWQQSCSAICCCQREQERAGGPRIRRGCGVASHRFRELSVRRSSTREPYSHLSARRATAALSAPAAPRACSATRVMVEGATRRGRNAQALAPRPPAVRSRSLRGQQSARTADPVSPPPGLELPPCELCRLPDRARALRFASTLLVGVPPLRPPSLLLPFTPHALPSEHSPSLALPHRLAATASPRARCALVLRKSRRLGRLWRRASLTAALPSIAPVPTASPLRPDP